MKILIVSSAPHSRCGIAKYALQQAVALRNEGHTVHFASVDGGTEGVEHPLQLRDRVADFARLAWIASRYDRVILQFQHDLFYRGLFANEIAAKNALLAALFKQHKGVEVVVHEMMYHLLDKGGVGRKVWMSERLKWRTAPLLVFHTKRELELFRERMPDVAARAVLREHHEDMVKFRDCTREEARAELDIPAAARTFLCIGFIQESKGFDRAVQAFQAVKDPDARLYIVGSVRVDAPEHRRYVELLRGLVAKDPRITLLERFLDDRDFDTWLIAADVVICPYRNIWSSGVAARSRLFQRRLLVASVGGLEDQLSPGDVVFHDENEFETALQRLAAGQPVGLGGKHRSGAGLRLAFVVPWFGQDIPGGAEAQARRTLLKLAERGAQVEVLTTQVKDYFSDWTVNARPAEERVQGVTVRRFPVQPRDADAFNAVNAKVVRRETLSDADLRTFQEQMLRCPGLPEYIAAHQDDYDLFVFVGYMWSTTVLGSRACPGKAVHIPCFHDEGYMDLAWYHDMIRQARGVLFNAPAEHALAQAKIGLAPGQAVDAGEGVDTDWVGDGEAFRRRHDLGEYLLFLGRKDQDKNFPLLVEYFRRYRDERAPDLTLVVMGPGGRQADPRDGASILDLGFAPLWEKRDALSGSLALVNPSLLESFSIVLMETWIARRPALVHADCDVTRDHCLTSGGGLYFRSYAEFAACVDRLRQDPELADRLGRAGRRYVLQNFTWSRVLDRYLEAFEGWRAARRAPHDHAA